MFINDVNKKEEIKNIAVKHLRELGVKYRPKKPRNIQDARIVRQCFKTALCLLPMQTVTLVSGQQLIVPKLLDDLCSFILANVSTEGLFRKGGSKARQNDIKLLLDSGSYLGGSHHEIDVANVLKTFFRELPEPLFPFSFHELFLHCALSSQQLEALLLSCLLLPTEHLNTLAYFMQFLHEVSEHSHLNKMDSHNLAIVIGPTLFPIEEKSALNSTQRLRKFCDICKLLIENASNIGFISDRIIDQIAPASLSADLEVNAKQKKKRRSGSLTRMFNGLRKIVSSKSIDMSTKSPDPLQTPNIKVSERKRRLDIQAFSNKKKHTLIQSLPQHTALSTPISVHPNPKKNSSPKSTSTNINTDKKWGLSKRNKQDRSNISSTLQRRWSAVSNATPGFKRNKMRNSCMVSSVYAQKEPEADYVKISRIEYEDIQNRVSAIEQRISLELDSAVETVQTVYESTLYKAEHLSPTDDQLARRLSKELKIRRSIDQRSPSARKIGNLRRRSRDLERQNNNRLRRNQSLQLPNQSAITLRRGQPNTLGMGLPNPSLIKGAGENKENSSPLEPQLVIARTGTINKSMKFSPNWSTFEDNSQTPHHSANLFQYRSSIVKLRNCNAGMVLAKARLFDQLVDSENNHCVNSRGTTHVDAKIGATRIRNLKTCDKRTSPRKRTVKAASFSSSNEEKENKVQFSSSFDTTVLCNSSDKSNILKDSNRLVSPNCATYKMTPQIKSSLSVNSPRYMSRTRVPNCTRQKTPVKVLTSQRF